MAIILPGGTLELAYPHHNIFGVPRELTYRTVAVSAIQDFAVRGLPAKWLIKRPLVRRGRTLIIGIEQLTLAEKSFWLEAQGRDSDLPEYRLGLYDPACPGEIKDWIGRIYGPTGPEQMRMRSLALKWLRIVKERGDIGLKMAAFPWEYTR